MKITFQFFSSYCIYVACVRSGAVIALKYKIFHLANMLVIHCFFIIHMYVNQLFVAFSRVNAFCVNNMFFFFLISGFYKLRTCFY